MAVDLIIFDCDGVLVDSEVLAARVEAELLERSGVHLTAAQICDRFVGLPAPAMRTEIERDWQVDLGERFEADRAALIAAAHQRHLAPIEGVAGVLDRLGVPGCVASSSRPERIAASLERTGLAGYFGAAVFSSTMVERGKPAPDLFLHAAAAMGVPPRACLVVEDSPPGVAAGLAAGMEVIGFAGGGHCGPTWADRLRRVGAPTVVASAADLGRVLDERGLSRPAARAAPAPRWPRR